MPLYAYHCSACGRDADQFNRIADRAHGPDCCGATMVQTLTAAMVQVPGGTDVNYRCQVTGQAVQSMRQRKYIMEKHDLVDARDMKDTWNRKLTADAAERAEVKRVNDSIPDAVKKAAMATVPPAGA